VGGLEGCRGREAGAGFDLAVEALVVAPVDVGEGRAPDVVEAPPRNTWERRILAREPYALWAKDRGDNRFLCPALAGTSIAVAFLLLATNIRMIRAALAPEVKRTRRNRRRRLEDREPRRATEPAA
jgi:hypothetical protein